MWKMWTHGRRCYPLLITGGIRNTCIYHCLGVQLSISLDAIVVYLSVVNEWWVMISDLPYNNIKPTFLHSYHGSSGSAGPSGSYGHGGSGEVS